MRLGNLYNLCSYQSPYPPVADKVVKRRREQAEEGRSRPAQAGIHPSSRHFDAGRNPPLPSFRRRPESSG